MKKWEFAVPLLQLAFYFVNVCWNFYTNWLVWLRKYCWEDHTHLCLHRNHQSQTPHHRGEDPLWERGCTFLHTPPERVSKGCKGLAHWITGDQSWFTFMPMRHITLMRWQFSKLSTVFSFALKELRKGVHLWSEIKTSNKSGYNTKILWNLTVRCEKEWNNQNVLLSFVSFQINFTTSCAAVIFLSLFVLVTWGSVWPKIQGILKKAHRGRHPPAIKTHMHARTHAQRTKNTESQNYTGEVKDKSKGRTACFSPNAPNHGPSSVLLKVMLYCPALIPAKISLTTFPLWWH